MFSKKYILTEIHGEIFFIKIKDIKIYNKIVMLPYELTEENKDTYYYARIIVDKIIGVLTDKDFKYLSVSYKDKDLNSLYESYNKSVHWDVDEGNIRLNNFIREFINKKDINDPITVEDVSIKPTTEIYELETFATIDGNNPFILEFDNEVDATLFYELNKNNFYKN